ncbi:OmpW family protein [Flagellimonas taeanensis]|uniref:Outer membrane protein n=1 Tax=Flagellimonas taeanensis TaxID=1005926 RepID=A0A1M7AGD5_9FLAO|nr:MULTISPECIES: OmpW family outer membrane protein [Allomuricauda]MDC6384782.1 outer membrane beta-barrel protein [Muricauda sp. SK9]MEE1962634.1 OmpW family outer membrane protein [Allomuricauda taeanensis]RIV53484.1 OmpW family protein [Allomuricauda taeanensis]SFC33464.1 outer membrane protein [Allomuricauda taeanensis]SHL41812.1 outer membrane protein [Allomuricauda taeanensis]
MRKTILFAVMAFMGFSNFVMSQDSPTNDFDKWQFRLRGIVVAPDEGADIEAIGGDVSISTSVVPEFDITYFFTENWSAELILGTTKHDVEAIGTAAGDIDLGSVWLLPPTLTGQYHFTGGNLVPYLGAGVNLTLFYGVDEGPVANDVEYDTAVGFALQGGFDFMLNDKWFLNLDIKKLFLNTTATVDATTALGATVEADVDIDPWIFGFGVGLKL